MYKFKCIKDSLDTLLHRVFGEYLNDARSGRAVSLFGTGIVSKELTRALLNNGIDIDSYVVTNKKWDNFNGKLVYSIEEYASVKTLNLVVIAISEGEDEVFHALVSGGISKKNIIRINYNLTLSSAIAEPAQDAYKWLQPYSKQYYLNKLNHDKAIIEFVYKNLEDEKSREILTKKIDLLLNWDSVSKLGEFLHRYSEPVLKFGTKPTFDYPESYFYFNNEFINTSLMKSYVDVGAYDGCSVERYLQFCKLNNIDNYSAYCFEPDPINFTILKQKFESNNQINLFKKGLWSSSAILNFKTSDSLYTKSSSCIDPLGEVSIEVVKFDDLGIKEEITLFKADPPGLDTAINVLEGASESIKKF